MDAAEFHLALNESQTGPRLSAESEAKLAPHFARREYSPGTLLFQEGSRHPLVYLILAGQVGLEMCAPGRGCTRILTVGPGEILAWSAFLGDGQMTATALALTETRTLAAAGQDLADLCAADRALGYEWMRAVALALSKRLTATRLQLLDLYGDARGNAP